MSIKDKLMGSGPNNLRITETMTVGESLIAELLSHNAELTMLRPQFNSATNRIVELEKEVAVLTGKLMDIQKKYGINMGDDDGEQVATSQQEHRS